MSSLTPKIERSHSSATSKSNQLIDLEAKKKQKKPAYLEDDKVKSFFEIAGSNNECKQLDLLDTKIDVKGKNKNGESLIHLGE